MLRRFLNWLFAETVGPTTPEEAATLAQLEEVERAAIEKRLVDGFPDYVEAAAQRRRDTLAAKWITLGRQMEAELKANDGVCSEEWHRLCDDRLDTWNAMSAETKKRASELYDAVTSTRGK